MITKKVNLPKLLEELKDFPVERIRTESIEQIDIIDKKEVKIMSMSIHPEININATKKEIQGIWQVIHDHKYESDYREKRYAEYGNIGEQLDRLYHDIDNGKLNKSGEFFKHIKKIKGNHPKSKIAESEKVT